MARFPLQVRGAVIVAPSGLDEYVAECIRGFVEVNDANSPWPKATGARLITVDSLLFAWCERVFESEFAFARGIAAPTSGNDRAFCQALITEE